MLHAKKVVQQQRDRLSLGYRRAGELLAQSNGVEVLEKVRGEVGSLQLRN